MQINVQVDVKYLKGRKKDKIIMPSWVEDLLH